MEIKETILAAVAVIVVTIVLLAMTPTIVAQTERVQIDAAPHGLNISNNYATRWNFTGASGAYSMLGLVPFIWVASVLLAAVAGMWSIIKTREQ